MFPPLDEGQIQLILSSAGLKDVGEIVKISAGFSNDVYSVSGKYVVKFGKSEEDEAFLRKEVYFASMFKKNVPTAPIVLFDFTKRVISRAFIVYEKVEGRTLYDRWHLLTPEERKRSILSIAGYLRAINETPYTEYVELFNIDTKRSWRDTVILRMQKNMRIAKNQCVFTLEEIELIDRFMLMHQDSLKVSRMALTYYDPHFDNFLIDEHGEVMAMLDFERTEFMSVDFVLDLVKRLVDFPKKYASENVEQFVKEEDYKDVWDWFEEGYPALFKFPEMESRLALYAVDHDMQELLDFPESMRARKEILRRVQA